MAEVFFFSFYVVGELFDILSSVSSEVFSFSPVDISIVNVDSFRLSDFPGLENMSKPWIFSKKSLLEWPLIVFRFNYYKFYNFEALINELN